MFVTQVHIAYAFIQNDIQETLHNIENSSVLAANGQQWREIERAPQKRKPYKPHNAQWHALRNAGDLGEQQIEHKYV